jgi:tetratricopeptide (TPR) repeat protein
MSRVFFVIVGAIVVAAALLHGTRQPPLSSVPASAAVEVPPLPRLAANDGVIALENLDAQIESLEKRAGGTSEQISLAERLQTRGQFTGCVADYERADALTASLVASRPNDPEVRRARANALATFHEFEMALGELDRAERLGARRDALDAPRSAIFEAQGRYDEAAAMLRKETPEAGPLELAAAGILAGERGDMAEATRLLDRARARYADVSPFPLAWMDVQEASLHERVGARARARRHYERALALVPRFARAAAHLAALSAPETAIAVLEPIASRCDDPEILAQLADALRRAGRLDEAATRQAAADARYDALLVRHPKAFADHAAVALLTTGRDPARALALADANARSRHTPEAVDLLLSTALAANDTAAACDAARDAVALPHATPDLRAVAAPIAAKCGPSAHRP